MRFTPLKPRVMKSPAGWVVMVPNIVFGDDMTARAHGPFVNWDYAMRAAVSLSAAIDRNIHLCNMQPYLISAVN